MTNTSVLDKLMKNTMMGGKPKKKASKSKSKTKSKTVSKTVSKAASKSKPKSKSKSKSKSKKSSKSRSQRGGGCSVPSTRHDPIADHVERLDEQTGGKPKKKKSKTMRKK